MPNMPAPPTMASNTSTTAIAPSMRTRIVKFRMRPNNEALMLSPQGSGIGLGRQVSDAGPSRSFYGPACTSGVFSRRSSRALDITLTELKAIAAPASTGLR